MQNKSLLLPFCLLAASAGAQQQKPNLVVIIADQWHGDALGCLNKEPVLTPNLDKLASQGINFTNAVSSYPVSSPARAMLMTGMYPMQNKVVGNCNSNSAPFGVELPQDAVCWSDVLNNLDYSLAYFGKWHLDAPLQPYVDTRNNKGKIAWNEWCPPSRRHGFEEWTAYGTYDDHLRPMYWNKNAKRNDFYFVNQWGPEYEASLAVNYLDSVKDSKRPFAMVVSMNPPHTGYNLVPDRYKQLYAGLDVEALCQNRPDIPAKGTKDGDYFRNNIRDYYACMTGVDENVGKIVAKLESTGLADNTIVIFSSDHGVCMGCHNIEGKNTFYEEAMRIPFIISWKGKIKPRTDAHTMISFGDIYPTALSLMGFKKDIPKQVQTQDLSAAVFDAEKGKNIIQPYFFIDYDDTTSGLRGLRTHRYTFAVHATKGNEDDIFLFDRTVDEHEMTNIAQRNPFIVKKLKKQLKKFLIHNNDKFAYYLK